MSWTSYIHLYLFYYEHCCYPCGSKSNQNSKGMLQLLPEGDSGVEKTILFSSSNFVANENLIFK